VAKLLLVFIVVPLVEALLLAKIGAALGWANTIVLVILTGIVGAWLFKLEGGRAWRKWQESLAQGRTPEEGVLGGLLLLLAGALLVTPGVITDGVGLALLFGPTRRMLSAWLMPQITDRFSRRDFGGGGGVRVVHFDMGGPAMFSHSKRDAHDVDDVGDVHEAVVVERRVRAGSRRAPEIIDVDFEVVDGGDD